MTTTAFSVEDVDLNTQLQVSGAISADAINNGVVKQVIGYAPTEFATLGINGVVNLNTQPGLSQAAGTPLRLPLNACVISATVDNNGTAVAGNNYDIGIAATITSNNDIFDAITPAIINAGGLVQNRETTNALGATGVIDNTPRVAALNANFVTVISLIGATTAGDLKLTISYILSLA